MHTCIAIMNTTCMSITNRPCMSINVTCMSIMKMYVSNEWWTQRVCTKCNNEYIMYMSVKYEHNIHTCISIMNTTCMQITNRPSMSMNITCMSKMKMYVNTEHNRVGMHTCISIMNTTCMSRTNRPGMSMNVTCRSIINMYVNNSVQHVCQ